VDQAACAGGQDEELILRTCIAIFSAAVLIGAAAFAFAGEPEEAEQSCDGSTYEIVECQKAKLSVLDKRLNAAYQKVLSLAQPKQKEQLRAAQRQWLKFRDADCEYYELGEGTIARIEGGECMLNLTRARARELERVVEP
jgi:uncharacterized protein YecT (DUF1311 family)